MSGLHLRTGLIVLLLALPAFAQKDFLTSSEIEQVREVQEPVARLKLYVLFATQRLEQVRSLMAKERAGRSGEIRQLLEDYTSIVDAMDTVSDDALIRKNDLTAGPAVIAEGEKKFLLQLQKIQDSAPHDMAMYDFELKEAIEATNESLELTNRDLGDRAREVTTKVDKQNKEAAAINAAERNPGAKSVADKSEQAASAAAANTTKPGREAPTLYRPGEKPDDPQQ